MLIPLTEILVKTESMKDISEIVEKFKKIQEANPDRTIKLSIEVSLKD